MTFAYLNFNLTFCTVLFFVSADVADLIYNSYRQEAIVKQAVLENVAHDHRDEFKMLHLAAWVHQPMIPYDLHKKLESMLTETGHR